MSKTPVDRGDQPLSAYLMKILTILVRSNPDQELRISALEMMDDLAGEGITRIYDKHTKELVLKYLPSNSEVFFVKGDDPWDAQREKLSTSQVPRQPTLTNEGNLRSTLDRASSLDDERLAQMEEDRDLKQRASELIGSFPQDQLRRTMDLKDRPLRQRSAQQQEEVERIPRSFLRTS